MHSLNEANKIWKQAQERSNVSGNRHECWQAWNDEKAARDYAAASKKRDAVKERVEYLSALVKPHFKILDVGAGPGTLAVPLSVLARQITAVEPASGMAAVLREEAEAARRTNISLVQKRWDDVLPQTDLELPYNLTIAAFSLGMFDLRESIEKMTNVTNGQIIIYWHEGTQSWERDSAVLWPLLHGREFKPVPKSDLVCRILKEMGINPDTQIKKTDSQTVYASFDEAREQFSRRYEAFDKKKQDLLDEYLRKILIQQNDTWILPRQDSYMKISWNTGVRE